MNSATPSVLDVLVALTPFLTGIVGLFFLYRSKLASQTLLAGSALIVVASMITLVVSVLNTTQVGGPPLTGLIAAGIALIFAHAVAGWFAGAQVFKVQRSERAQWWSAWLVVLGYGGQTIFQLVMFLRAWNG